MARTHKTAMIKVHMAEEARKEEEARRMEAARLAGVMDARTRAARSQARQRADEIRGQFGPHAVVDEEASASEGMDGDSADALAEVPGHEEGTKECVSEASRDSKEGPAEKEEGEESQASDQETREENTMQTNKMRQTGANRQGKTRSASMAEHESWADLEVSLKQYMDSTRQKIVIKVVIRVSRRNADLRAQVRYNGRPDSEIPLVPVEMEPFQRKYICTHGWPERERSSGKRTSHTLRRTECPFEMLAQVSKKDDGT
ncbi:hypothetical protein PInf_010283 [Phytophthora infestans]|nr:hypothetical protein PInf_010283 [Phytophthora infestans]